MKLLLRTAIISILVLALLAGACGSIRWARRGSTAAGFAANALMLTFGMGLIATPPQRGVQQVQEQEDRTGGDSGDPPSHG
jgi:hypothetical protein